ncbi:HBL295Wp [Eremothecium sinecaudum]|uniref:HBL295Wp n=1 Tax=Eremothecium sinecaudum TaxID=45286 RepID=A0A109UWT7_9SACH|nr:HBL295Wp [Eremothecium sinecaudum]AMD18607.1 HBL295Wp [Eremothecium sinecaudum]
MSSDFKTGRNDESLSRTASIEESYVSDRPEEHRELYDHRQQRELPQRRLSTPAREQSGGRSIIRDLSYYGKSEQPPQFKTNGLNMGISFEDDSDQEYSGFAPRYEKHGRSIKTPSSRAPRVVQASHQLSPSEGSKDDTGEKTDRKQMEAGANKDSEIVRDSRGQGMKKKSRAHSESSSQAPQLPYLTRYLSHKSQDSAVLNSKLNRMVSVGSDDSKGSRQSQETEEDVCFPMQQPEHTRINGIDFDELEEFVADAMRGHGSRYETAITDDIIVSEYNKLPSSPGTSSGTSTSQSSAALKYIPKNVYQKNATNDNVPGISFGNNKIEADDYIPMNELSAQQGEGLPETGAPNPGFNTLPPRFSFFRPDAEDTVHSPDIPSLIADGQTFRKLFKDGTSSWWLDCICPTDEEMRCIAKAFGIHPLTAEDIRMQEPREKVELFKSYYFVCFHTFENDPESAEFLEPINVYIVVFRHGVLTFHFTPVSHTSNVRRRVRQLRDYVDVNSDWICYALIDDITDSFAPVIQGIEYEADFIEDNVFQSRDSDVALYLQSIGEGRRKTMTLMRLLSGKADVIKMFAKRCQDESNGIGPALTSEINIANLQLQANDMPPKDLTNFQLQSPEVSSFDWKRRTQPRADIALYLGDIQDHVVTMVQNLLSYEKIFSRSLASYLAQLQVESLRCNNKVTSMLGKVTMIGTMLIPLNVITGMFGMNVNIPGTEAPGYNMFIVIVFCLVSLAVTSWIFSSWWVSRINRVTTLNELAEPGTRSVINFSRFRVSRRAPKIHPSKSVKSFPSKLSRYC